MDFVIYKIFCITDETLLYIGSTQNFHHRNIDHKTSCNNPNCRRYNSKKYVTIRQNGGWNNWNMVIIDELKNVTKIESRQKEEEWRVKLNANLNSVKCYTSEEEKKYRMGELKKQYREDNKEQLTKYYKGWAEKNKDIILKKDRERSAIKVKCECGCEIRRDSLSKHKRSKKHIELMSSIEIII